MGERCICSKFETLILLTNGIKIQKLKAKKGVQKNKNSGEIVNTESPQN